MKNIDQVIQELKAVIAEATYPDRPRKFMIPLELAESALALLKAQEPRVMTLEEYKALAEKPREERDPVWKEWPSLESTWAIPNQGYGGYGTSWRCWTARPTEKQRQEVKWNG